jgi:hypothetical protein
VNYVLQERAAGPWPTLSRARPAHAAGLANKRPPRRRPGIRCHTYGQRRGWASPSVRPGPATRDANRWQIARWPVAGVPVAGLPVAGVPVAGVPVAGVPVAGTRSTGRGAPQRSWRVSCARTGWHRHSVSGRCSQSRQMARGQMLFRWLLSRGWLGAARRRVLRSLSGRLGPATKAARPREVPRPRGQCAALDALSHGGRPPRSARRAAEPARVAGGVGSPCL